MFFSNPFYEHLCCKFCKDQSSRTQMCHNNTAKLKVAIMASEACTHKHKCTQRYGVKTTHRSATKRNFLPALSGQEILGLSLAAAIVMNLNQIVALQ